MSSVTSLREHLVDELNDLLNAEQQLVVAIPKMAEKASRRELKAAFRSHLAETKGHVKRATEALELLGETSIGKACEAMKGLLKEGEELMNGADGGALRDAMLITAAQKVEHYEIATYGTVRTYAQVLGAKGVAKLMAQTLKEEKAADKKLSGIAEGSVNKQAAKEWHAQTGVIGKGAEWIGSTVGGAIKKVLPSHAADRSTKRRRSRRTKRRA
jgi:ferritin-like metal-binding protein YciE